jgi:uncharacterized protein (DUF58 family)
MLPIPTRSAVLAFCGSVAMLLVALIWSSPTTAMLAGGALLGLSAALALTMPLGARLRRQRLEFSWWLGHGETGHTGAGVVVGMLFEVRCCVRNRDHRPLRFTELLPVAPPGVEVHSGLGCELSLPARARTELSFRLSANAAGRVVLQGLAVAAPGPFGLFLSPLYFPSPLTVKVLPRTVARRESRLRLGSSEAVERSGRSPLRRRGAGTELHEIREHRPGDAFKAIAWKPSARAGKLLVREVERELQDTLELIVDVSGSMRGGRPGERKLDHCIELAALLAQQALERGDRVGLLTVDGRVLSRVAEAEGMQHMLRVYNALLEATEVVDADLTEVDDEAVTAIVGLYLRKQEGVELSGEGGWDMPAIAAHVARALQSEVEAQQVVASSPEHAQLRRFCRVRGIALPYRAETRGSTKAAGLGQALRKAASAQRTPRTLLVLSDLDGVHDPEPLLRALRLLKAGRHNLVFIVPDAESFLPDAATDLEHDLRRVYGMQERRRLLEMRSLLGKLGIAVLTYDARQGSALLLRRAGAPRRVA